MNSPRYFHLVAALGLSFTASAQSASPEEWFNKAAHQYVKEDRMAALRTLDQALAQHPGDARLLRLAEELLKENEQDPKEQQQQEQEQQQQDQQDQQDQKNGNEGKDEQDKDQEDGRSKDGDQRKDQQEPSSQDPEKGNEQQPDQGKEEELKGSQQAPKDRISPQDAKRMLEALDRQERLTLEKARERERPVKRSTTDKDW